MGFNKNKGLSVVVVLIMLVVLNIVAFVFPTVHNVTFWLGYSFAILAALIMLAVAIFFFDSKDNYKLFLRLSLVKSAWIYFVLQMLLSFSQILNMTIPYLTALIVNTCLTGFYLIVILSAHVATESIEEQEEEVNQKILFLQNIQVMLQSTKTEDAELALKIERLNEDFQYSDPMSHSMLSELEKQIETKVSLLKADISDVEKAKADVDAISSLLEDRNLKCKMLKNVREEKKEKNNSGVKYVTVAIGVIGMLTTVALAICFWFVPNNKYNFAMSLYDTEQYAEAIVVFESIKGFRNSDEMIVLSEEGVKESIYQEAQELYVNQNYAEAIVVFKEIEGYKDSKEMIHSAEDYIKGDSYEMAEKYFDEQNYVEALKLYTVLGDYEDCTQKIEQIYNRLSEEDGIVYYGTYKDEPIAWQTVKAEKSRILLIAQKPICDLPYNEELKNVEWNESTLCEWLNSEFIKSFTEEQAEAIISTQTDGTENKVFLLSQKEVKNVKNSILKCDQEWWLRTQSKSNALFVKTNGKVDTAGENVVRAKGVRPAMWLSLE